MPTLSPDWRTDEKNCFLCRKTDDVRTQLFCLSVLRSLVLFPDIVFTDWYVCDDDDDDDAFVGSEVSFVDLTLRFLFM